MPIFITLLRSWLEHLFVAGVGGELSDLAESAERTEVTVMDELQRIRLREDCGDGSQKRLHLDLAVRAQPGADAVEVSVVIGRMADDLIRATHPQSPENL